ncbi:exported hypothetical protein [Verrucomicrobia bacterium]|nr:exported hypothetical protein [Verrucomicrobiota bacterium]
MTKANQAGIRQSMLLAAAAALLAAATPGLAQLNLGPPNPGFENGSSSWFSGGTGGTAGSVSFLNPGQNGPSAPGTNAVSITSDGTGNTDFRSVTFSLGSAAGGAQPVTFSFDYDILGTVTPGNNVRVGLRTWLANNNNNFEGENNSFIGDNTGDSGGTGWETFSVTYTPSASANFADIRVSMNVFNHSPGVGDYWTDGTVLFDNFSVTTVPEPGVLALFGLGALTLVARTFRRR